MERREHHPAAHEAESSEDFCCLQPSQTPKRKKNKMKNKRRFSDEQIRLLESIFESETKLEPGKKLQVAGELGLQPRQVAIWFQNKRARWKSKQIEQDYRTLKANYDNLASRFESLKKEKQALLIQLQKLSELLAKPHEVNKGGKLFEGSSTDGGSDNGDTRCEPEANQSFLQAELEERGFFRTQNENDRNMGHSRQEGRELLSMGDYAHGSPASPGKWYGFDSGGLIEEPSNSSNWLNFWI